MSTVCRRQGGANNRKLFLTSPKAGSPSQVPGRSVSDEDAFPGW